MEVAITSITNQEKGKRKLPAQFDEQVRPDLIKRAVLVIMSKERQQYGAKEGAGQRASGKLSRRRRDYKASYGMGISRVPRKVLSRRGTRMYWVGAVAPGTVGGRKAHPPKFTKDWTQKINVKENRKAIRSCLAATVSLEWAQKRGKTPVKYPIIVDKSFEDIESTKKLRLVLESFGITIPNEIKIRVGKAKARGRKYKEARGILLVVSKECPVIRAATNLTGVEVCEAAKLNAEILAPGAQPGRITIYTSDAIDKFESEKLFT